MDLLKEGAVAVVGLVAVGCASGQPPRSTSAAPVTANLVEAAPPAVLVDAGDAGDAAAMADAGAPSVLAVHTPDLLFAFVEPWHEPSVEHPRGTVLGLAYARDESNGVWFVEVDIAQAAPVARRLIWTSPESRFQMTRVGDLLYLGVQDAKDFLWVTYDLTLTEVRRVRLPGLSRADLRGRLDAYDAFGVHEGHAIVVTERDTGTRADVFDTKGRRTAIHECKPLHHVTSRARLAYAGELAVIENIYSDARAGVCVFHADGSGPTRIATDGMERFALNGRVYLWRDYEKLFALDDRLQPTGEPVADPRPAVSTEPCKPRQAYAWAWGSEVLLVAEACCDDTWGALSFCFPRGPGPTPPTGRTEWGDGAFPRVDQDAGAR